MATIKKYLEGKSKCKFLIISKTSTFNKNFETFRETNKQKNYPRFRKNSINRKFYDCTRMLDLADKYFKAAIINMLKHLLKKHI